MHVRGRAIRVLVLILIFGGTLTFVLLHTRYISITRYSLCFGMFRNTYKPDAVHSSSGPLKTTSGPLKKTTPQSLKTTPEPLKTTSEPLKTTSQSLKTTSQPLTTTPRSPKLLLIYTSLWGNRPWANMPHNYQFTGNDRYMIYFPRTQNSV